METNYKQLDRNRVLLYLKEHRVSTVDAIVEERKERGKYTNFHPPPQ